MPVEKAPDYESLFKLLIENIPYGITVNDADLRLLSINSRHARLNNLSVEAQIGQPLASYLPHAADIIAPKLRFVLEHKQPLLDQEVRATEPDARGHYLHRLASYYPWLDAQGDSRGVLAVIRDSTVDDVAAALLEESQQRLLRVLDNLNAFVGVMDLDGTLIHANRAPLEAAGITLESVRGMKCWDTHWIAYDPAVRARFIDAYHRALSGEVVRFDMPVRMASEQPMWIDFMMAPLRDGAGHITHLIPSGMDISERHAGELALHASEERYRSVIESSDDAIIIKSLDGIITGWNPAAERLLGYAADDIVGLPITTLFPQDRLAEEALIMERIRRGERIPSFETERIHKQGHAVEVAITVSPLRDRDGQVVGVCKLARDVSLSHRQMRALEQALHEKTALLQEVHHRVKNNLQIVSSLLNLQSRKASPELAALLAESQGRIRAMALVHQLIYESDNFAEVGIGDYVMRLVGLLDTTYSVSGKGMRLVSTDESGGQLLDVPAAIPVGLVLNELVLNAIKHAFPAGEAGEIRVRIAVEEGNSLMLSVSDDGCGLPGDAGWAERPGLGGQLIPMFVRQLGGQMQVGQENGRGTLFRLVFPCRRASGV